MKTKKHYTMSAMGVVNTPETNVVATFKGAAGIYEGPIGDLVAWAREHNAFYLVSCTSEGNRHGLFPCLLATNERVAAGLSVLSGYEVAVGDGRTYYSKAQALEDYRALTLAGIPIGPEAFIWGITDVPYTAKEEPAKAPVAQQEKLPF